MAHDDREANVVDNLSALIGDALVALEAERTHPRHESDRMDDTIKFYERRVKALRVIRQQFEDEMARMA
jgi:hypothetical protein